MTSAEPQHLAEGWPEPGQFRKSVRTEFSLLVAGMMTLLMLVFGYVMTEKYVSTVLHHVVKSLLVQARSSSVTAGNHIMAGTGSDQLMLNNICKELALENPDIYWVGLAGPDRRFLAHTDIRQVIAEAELQAPSEASDHELLAPGETMTVRSDTLYIVLPIAEEGVVLGHLGIASSTRAIRSARNTSILTVVAITCAIMLVGIPFTVFRLRRKLRPIIDIAQNLRQIDLDRLTLNIPYEGKNEIGFLAANLRVMGRKLNQAQQELIEKERLAQEMQIAHEIQASILPRDYPQGDRFAFAGMYRSAKEVGGDYYDFIEFDRHQLAFIVADVSGKSLPGMLVMLLTRDIIKKLTHAIREPAELLSAANRELFGNIREGMFVTMLFGVLDKETGHCEFASAGHNSVVQVDGGAGSAGLIKTKGFPLGLVGPDTFDQRIESREMTLNPGDWLILYTDGISEAQNAQGEQYGMTRFLDLVQSTQADSAEALVAKALSQHEAFVGTTPQYDDITLLALKWQGAGVGAGHTPAREANRGVQ